MADNCLIKKLTADVLIDCDHIAVAGIESDILFIPSSDIDRTASKMDTTNKNILTKLVLKSGAKGYLLQGVKQVGGFESEFIKGDSQTLNKFKHTVRGRILSPSAVNREQFDHLASGESYVAVVNKKYKGKDQEDAFLVLGYESGLYLSEGTESSTENDGQILIVLESDDEMLENKSPKTLLETSYDATLTAFDNKFASN